MAILGGCLAMLWGRVGELMLTSFLLALAVAAITMPIALLLGMLIGKSNLPFRTFPLLLLGAILLLPLHQIASGWIAALGFRGWLSVALLGPESHQILLEGVWGAVIVHAAAAIPWATLLTIAALRNTSSKLEELALLDASQWRVFFRVTLPESLPALCAIMILVMTSACTEIAATDLFQVRTFAEEVYTQSALGNYQVYGLDPSSGLVGFLAGVLLMVTIVYVALYQLQVYFIHQLQEEDHTVWVLKFHRFRYLFLSILLSLIGFVVLVPIVALMFKAGVFVIQTEEAWQRNWSIQTLIMGIIDAPVRHRRELFASIKLAVLVATFVVFAGSLIAWALRDPLAQKKRSPKKLLLLIVSLLVALPGPLVGLLVIVSLNQPLDSPIAFLGELYGTWFAPWLAQSLRILPLVSIALWPAMASLSNSLVEAAKTDGASFTSRMFKVIYPNRWAALVAAWMLAFGLSLGELSATALVVPPGTPPLSVRVLSLLHYGVEDQVAALSLFMILMSSLISLLALGFYRVVFIRKKHK